MDRDSGAKLQRIKLLGGASESFAVDENGGGLIGSAACLRMAGRHAAGFNLIACPRSREVGNLLLAAATPTDRSRTCRLSLTLSPRVDVN